MPGRTRRTAIAVITLAVLWPTLVLGQAPKAGVVTTLEGTVTATRVATAAPVSLRFKDDVLLQDRITTAEQSFARLLLGGKAVVTVRERSQFTVTEIPGQSIVDLQSGKLAVGIARERMRPGERFELRTPGAIVAVRGTVLIAEVSEVTPGGQRRETIYLMRGTAEFQVRTAAGVTPPASVTLGAFQSFTVIGGVATIGTFTDADVAAIVAGLKAKGMQFTSPANSREAKTTAQLATTAALKTLLLIGPAPTLPSIRETVTSVPNKSSDVPLNPLATPTTKVSDLALAPLAPVTPQPGPPVPLQPEPVLPEPLNPEPEITRLTLQPGETLKTFPAGTTVLTQGTPVVPVEVNILEQLGPDNLIDAPPSSVVQIASRLLDVKNSEVLAGASVFRVSGGDFTSTGQESLIGIDPSFVNAPNADFLRIDSGGRVTLTAAPFVTSLNSVLAAGQNFLHVTDEGSSLSLAAGLFSFQDSAVVAANDLVRIVGGASVDASTSKAPLVTLTGTGAGSLLGTETALVAGQTLFFLQGRATEIRPPICNGDCSPAVGADEPLRPGSGPVLEVTNASVSAPQAFTLEDASLVQAIATSLLSIQAGGSLNIAGADAIALSRSRLETAGPVALVNGGVFTVNDGALVRLDNSFLRVNGDLLHIANGGLVNLVNGPLITLNGSSLAEISGALAAFIAGTGNRLVITNNLCATGSCFTLNGVRIATSGEPSISINGTPFRTDAGAQGTVTLSPDGAHVFVQSGSTLRVGPQSLGLASKK